MAMRDSTDGGWSRTVRAGLAGAALLALAACTAQVRHHGYAPDDRDLARITVGQDTRETVAEAIGRPSSTGLMRDSAWYYVASARRHYGWREPQEIDREVVAVSFSDAGAVANIERFGLEDGRVVALSRRVTDTNIRGVTLIEQLFRNIGSFSAGQFF